MKRVLITGVFDLLHAGHFKLLRYAKLLGKELIVAIDSDNRVHQIKGWDRPYFSQAERKFMLEENKHVDKVLIFNSDEELIKICRDLNPYYRVVGSDWKGKKIIGEEFSEQIKYYERIPGYSTTNILKGIKP